MLFNNNMAEAFEAISGRAGHKLILYEFSQ